MGGAAELFFATVVSGYEATGRPPDGEAFAVECVGNDELRLTNDDGEMAIHIPSGLPDDVLLPECGQDVFVHFHASGDDSYVRVLDSTGSLLLEGGATHQRFPEDKRITYVSDTAGQTCSDGSLTHTGGRLRFDVDSEVLVRSGDLAEVTLGGDAYYAASVIAERLACDVCADAAGDFGNGYLIRRAAE